MGTSARRFGIENDDLELEQRLRRMEGQLEKRQLAQYTTSESAMRRARSDVPRISGVRLDNEIVGGLGVRWNPVDQPDIRRYVIEVATDNSFRNSDSFTTVDPFYVFPNLTSGQQFYVRVKAQNARQEDSPWSAVLNTATGQATFQDLQSGAAGNIVITTQTSGFQPTQVTAATSGLYATTRLSLPTTAEVLIFGFAKFDYSYVTAETIFVDVLVDGVNKQTYETKLNTVSTAGRSTIPGLGFPQLLGQGSHRFEFQVRISSGGSSTVNPVEFTLGIWEQRR